jgi:hypothetical protein
MLKTLLLCLLSVNTTLAFAGNAVPILTMVDSKLIVDLTNLVITAVMGTVTAIGVAYVKAKYQKRKSNSDD